MKHRLDVSMTDRATIQREEQTGTGGAGGKEELYETVVIAEDVRCQYTPNQTLYERTEAGERTEKPAMVRFPADTDIRAGDIVDVDGVLPSWEVQGVDVARDPYYDRIDEKVANLSRRD